MGIGPEISVVVLDLHGVLIHERTVIPSAPRAIQTVRDSGLAVRFLTNASARTRRYMSDVLRAGGIRLSIDEMITAGWLVGRHLSDMKTVRDVYTVGGGAALLSELRSFDIEARPLTRWDGLAPAPRTLVVGHTTRFTVTDAHNILKVAGGLRQVVAAESDRWYATSNGPFPGIGWITAAIENITQLPIDVVGKPSAYPLEYVARELQVATDRILMVGDSVESDMMAARASGAKGLLVGRSAAGAWPLTVPDISALPDFLGLMPSLAPGAKCV